MAREPTPEPEPGRDRGLALLREMLRIRRFEEKCAELYGAGKIQGFLHLYIGEEAVAAGLLPALAADDAIVSTYREHGHALARGVPMGAVMAEMYGKASGCSRGRGGSMHLFDAGRRFYGGNAIVGGALPLAVGLALADQVQARSRVTACIFGDGAVAEGTFHESLNLAALWKLPVLFLCENNLYAMGTQIARHQSRTDIAAKAQAYGFPGAAVDGMDVLAVEAAARRAVDFQLVEGFLPWSCAVRGARRCEFFGFRRGGIPHRPRRPSVWRRRRDLRWRAGNPVAAGRLRLAKSHRETGLTGTVNWRSA